MPDKEEVKHLVLLIAYVVDIEHSNIEALMDKMREDGAARLIDTMTARGPEGDYDGIAKEIAKDMRRKLNG